MAKKKESSYTVLKKRLLKKIVILEREKRELIERPDSPASCIIRKTHFMRKELMESMWAGRAGRRTSNKNAGYIP